MRRWDIFREWFRCEGKSISSSHLSTGSDRIYTGVRVVPKGTKVYNKTGSTARVCGDMGILNVKGSGGKWYPYTVIGIIEKEQNAANYTSWIRSRGNIIRNVSGIVYQSIAQNHNI